MISIIYALGLESSLRSLFNEFREHTDIKIDFFNRNVGKRFDKGKGRWDSLLCMKGPCNSMQS